MSDIFSYNSKTGTCQPADLPDGTASMQKCSQRFGLLRFRKSLKLRNIFAVAQWFHQFFYFSVCEPLRRVFRNVHTGIIGFLIMIPEKIIPADETENKFGIYDAAFKVV